MSHFIFVEELVAKLFGKYPHDKASSALNNNTSREDAKARRGREQARRLKSRGGRALQNYQASRNQS